MSFISFAQNFEDVLLWRALKDVEQGCYVDVGAQHPRIDSVSQAFHDHGWRGIHVEPSPQYAEMLRDGRPGDIVLEAAVGSKRGKAVFHNIPDTGLSTFDTQAMEQALARGFMVEDISVDMILLDDVFEGAEGIVHWLKIDVEGYETQVIRGWTCVVRPWVLVIESTSPGQQVETDRQWEADVLAKGYRYVWFDGLNRFYVHEDHAELAERIAMPPNVFDEAALSGESTSNFAMLLRHRIEGLERELAARPSQGKSRAQKQRK